MYSSHTRPLCSRLPGPEATDPTPGRRHKRVEARGRMRTPMARSARSGALVLVMVVALAGCASANVTPAPTAADFATPTEAPTDTATPTATATEAPTDTPTPTAAPSTLASACT